MSISQIATGYYKNKFTYILFESRTHVVIKHKHLDSSQWKWYIYSIISILKKDYQLQNCSYGLTNF